MINHPETSKASDYSLTHPYYREITVQHPDNTMRIELIEPQIRYAAESLKWLSQNEIGQYMGADFSVLSLENEEKRMQEILKSTDAYNWMIELNGEVIGNGCINSIAEQSTTRNCKAGSMAILIGDKKHWGKKIARHVNQAIIDWAFQEAEFNQLHARIMEQNIGSIKSFERLGFTHTATEEELIDGKTIHWNHYELKKDSYGN